MTAKKTVTPAKKPLTRAEILKQQRLQAIEEQQAAQNQAQPKAPPEWHFMIISPEHLDLVFPKGRPEAGTEVKLIVSEIGTLGAVIDLVVVEKPKGK